MGGNISIDSLSNAVADRQTLHCRWQDSHRGVVLLHSHLGSLLTQDGSLWFVMGQSGGTVGSVMACTGTGRELLCATRDWGNQLGD